MGCARLQHVWVRSTWGLALASLVAFTWTAMLPGTAAQAQETASSGTVPSETSSASVAASESSTSTPIAGLPPGDCVRLVRKARIAEMQGDLPTAVATLRTAVERFPDELVALEALIALGRRGGLEAAERQSLLELFARRLEQPEPPVPTAVLRYLVHSPDADETMLRQVAQRVAGESVPAPHDPQGLELLADIYARLGEDAAALDATEKLYAATGDEGQLWSLYLLNRRLERWPEAAGWVETLVAAGRVGLRAEWVRLLAKAGDTETLLTQLEILESESFANLGPGMLEDLAWSLIDAGHRLEAEPLLRRAVSLGQAGPQVATVLSLLYGSDEERQAQDAAADDAWQTEDDVDLLFEEGTQRLTVGDAAGAIDLLERAAQGMPNFEAAWYNLGLAAYRLERWDAAAEAFATTSRLNPRRVQSHLYLGIALAELERCGEAVGALENAVGMDPSQSLAHYHLASCYRTLGETGAADTAWQRYQDSKRDDG